MDLKVLNKVKREIKTDFTHMWFRENKQMTKEKNKQLISIREVEGEMGKLRQYKENDVWG